MAVMGFPCKLESGLGRFRTLTEAEEIAQSVRMILTTRRGERPFRPKFGTQMDRFAFEGIDSTTCNLIRQEAVAALQTWEPRICKIEVAFEHQPERGVLLIHVSYQVRRSGAIGTQTVPLAS